MLILQFWKINLVTVLRFWKQIASRHDEALFGNVVGGYRKPYIVQEPLLKTLELADNNCLYTFII